MINRLGPVTYTIDVQGLNVTLNSRLLAVGRYNYTLYVNGREVDSKQMLITR